MARSDSANLDLIRAAAVMCVFGAHLRDQLTGTGADISWAFGQMGVFIFFVHTSLVLMLSLERSASRLASGPLVLDFFVRRFFRIYPLSVLCVTLAFLGFSQTHPGPWSWPTYLSNVALTMNLTYSEDMWPVLWTLPLEVQMYLVLPVLFLVLRERPLGYALGLWGLAVLSGVIQPQVSGRLTLAAYAPCFIGGVIAWRLMHTVRPRFHAAWWPLVFVASWTVWLLAERRGDPEYNRWMFCLTLGCLIPWFRDLQWTPLVAVARTVAKYSYGFYLAHFPVIVLAMTFDGPLRWFLLIGLGVLIPVAMYHLIEQPMIDVGRRLAARVATASMAGGTPLRIPWSVVPALRRLRQYALSVRVNLLRGSSGCD